MKALVTGATGFVGSHLVDSLRRAGHDVTVLIRSPAKARRLAELGLNQVAGDLFDRTALLAAAAGQDVVFHVAGLVAARDEADFLRVNRDGTANLVAAAAHQLVQRFVLVSSMAAGGPAERGRPLRGGEPPRPVTAYGRSKLAGEDVVRTAPMPWTIIRPPMVYGPRDREVLKVFQIARLGVAPVFGTGDQELSAIHGADLAAALLAAAGAAKTQGGTYYACHPEVFSSREFVQAVGAAMGRRAAAVSIPLGVGRTVLRATGALASLAGRTTILTADKANEFFQPAWTGDPTPLTEATGWTAKYDLAGGLRDTYAWYRAAGWL
jgi:nucleoside-diphosphate-sugar epimerase